LATKLAAFEARGGRDPRRSHDFKDIVYLLNYTSNFRMQILDSEPKVQKYLKEQFETILEKDNLQEAIIGNLYYEERQTRFERIISEIINLINSIQ
jgi:hypothetical protein